MLERHKTYLQCCRIRSVHWQPMTEEARAAGPFPKFGAVSALGCDAALLRESARYLSMLPDDIRHLRNTAWRITNGVEPPRYSTVYFVSSSIGRHDLDKQKGAIVQPV